MAERVYERLQPPNISKNPKENANIFSIFSFWWMNDTFALGNKRPLENDDLIPLLDEDKTRTSTEKLQHAWNVESKTCGQRRKHLLMRSLLRMFHWTEYASVLMLALMSALANFLQPVLLSFLLPDLITPSPGGRSRMFVYAAGICFASFVTITSGHQYTYRSTMLAIRWRSATMGMLLNKVKLYNFSENYPRVVQPFLIIFRNFSKLAEDVQRFLRKIRGCFDSRPTSLVRLTFNTGKCGVFILHSENTDYCWYLRVLSRHTI